jgi:ABC-type transport system substrate-binding protein
MSDTLSRRRFLRSLAAAVAGTAVVSCQPQTVVVKETVEVEKVVKETVEVEKVVKETVVVEKTVEAPETEKMSAVQEIRAIAPGAWGDAASFDPTRWGNWGWNTQLWAPLLAGDSEGNVVPEKSLAEGFDVSDDGTVYTFYLREQAKFSDGTPIVAQELVDNLGYWAMMYHPKAMGYKGNYGNAKLFFHDVVGLLDAAKDAEYDEFGILPVPGAEAVDDFTLRLTLKQPPNDFILRMTFSFNVFKTADMLAGKDAEYGLNEYWPATAETSCATSGPYKIAKFVPGDRVELVPNEYYFGPKFNLSKITLYNISDANTQLAAFANRELDVIGQGLQGDALRQALADSYLNSCLARGSANQIHQFWVTATPPLDDVHARRAFSMAIDRDTLLKIKNAGAPIELYMPVKMHVSPELPSCQEEAAQVEMLPFDPAQAKEELQKSEYWPDVVDMEINIATFANAANLPECEAVQAMLTENLGMNNVVVRQEQLPDLTNPPFPLHLWRNAQSPWYPSLAVLLLNMAALSPDEPWDTSQNRSFVDPPYVPELEEKVNEAMLAQTMAEKCKLCAEAGQIWNDQVFSLDIWTPSVYVLIAPWVKELEFKADASRGEPFGLENVWIAQH